MPASLDYDSLGLMCGIEIHQQLDTTSKLFCGSPTILRDVEDSNFEFFRYLRPTRSELGEIDKAALEEVLISRKFIYKSYDTTSLVEADEEPPSELNREALEIVLVIARLLNMQIVDEIHTMRKLVIDGSNTSGFQRTAYVASDGYMETSCGKVCMESICLEEDAAKIIEDRGDEVVYSLDRLGIPLVEICTAPDIVSPQHAREVAQHLGMVLRSTGQVKRGLGTIRQDVNVSIRDGARIELKGVQDLNLVDTIVEREALRQANLLEIRDELIKKGASVDDQITDVSHLFADTESGVIFNAIKKAGVVLAVKLVGFDGLVGREIQPDRRLGTEFSDRAKRVGVNGIFHTDELPAYGITEQKVKAVRTELAAEEDDCVVMVAAQRDRAEAAMAAVLERAREALKCVPEEVRRALPDGTSEYMRPLPGSARMYPETDVPPVVITEKTVENLELPELFDERTARFERDFGLNPELAGLMATSPNCQFFEDVVHQFSINPALVVRILEVIPRELTRDGVPISNLTEQHYADCFALVSENKIAKEGLPELLKVIAEQPESTASEAAEAAGLIGVDQSRVEDVVHQVVAEKEEFIRERGERAQGPLMGLAMKELRGKADGGLVSSILKSEIEKLLK
ncbi:MAG: Glu-tRNA(Gln) amidotransferase subunit GatE [Methanotrichaceae archaeon]